MTQFPNCRLARLVIVICLLVGMNAAVFGQNNIGQAAPNAPAQFRLVKEKAVEYLRLQGQSPDGSFNGKVGVGPTALVVTGLLAVGISDQDPLVAKAVAFLLSNVRADGGIYSVGSRHQNYDTCIALAALSKANVRGRYDSQIKAATAYVKKIQWDAGEGKELDDTFYGGSGYDSKGRPDLSNTSFLIEALREIGKGTDDESIQAALVFVSRCQNLEGPYNTTPNAAKVNDGGFYYTAAGGGESKAGADEASGGLRSYGSMTYAGLKSMIYAGVDKEDYRVKAAVEFLRKNYTLETNPGMGTSGLYYYYHTMAKALDAFAESDFKDARGQSHDWKQELLAKLSSLQQPNGSWVNSDARWMEGDPILVTGYALLALAMCKP